MILQPASDLIPDSITQRIQWNNVDSMSFYFIFLIPFRYLNLTWTKVSQRNENYVEPFMLIRASYWISRYYVRNNSGETFSHFLFLSNTKILRDVEAILQPTWLRWELCPVAPSPTSNKGDAAKTDNDDDGGSGDKDDFALEFLVSGWLIVALLLLLLLVFPIKKANKGATAASKLLWRG